jgi:vacuolar protein sorting-associated protein 26
MELEIRRRESTGSGTNMYVETETLAKFELMDGVPIRGLQLLTLHSFLSFFIWKNEYCLINMHGVCTN